MTFSEKRKSGVILPLVVIVMGLVGIISAGLFSYLSFHRRSQQRFMLYDLCRLAAQTAIEMEKFETKTVFENYYQNNSSLRDIQDWFDEKNTGERTSIGKKGYENAMMKDQKIDGCRVSVIIKKVEREKYKSGKKQNLYTYGVTYLATAEKDGVSKSIQETVEFGMARSRVFDYAYFVNNYGWFKGGGGHANGDIRSNGDMYLDGKCTINGNIYAAENDELDSSGDVMVGNNAAKDESPYKRHDDIDDYRRYSNNRTRPTSPTAGDGEDGKYDWVMGYDGESKLYPQHEPIPMPFISELDGYKVLAHEMGGTIKMNGSNIVDAVYEGPGPSGIKDGPDQGCLILDGTKTPIEINGPVVVDRDVIIKGKVKGQGAIYSGRNVHIVGDLTYVNPPKWNKPDAHPEKTAEKNSKADLLTLAAKGNIVLGNSSDRDWYEAIEKYISSSFVKPYQCDKSDNDIGYKERFNGDYRAKDGLYKAVFDVVAASPGHEAYDSWERFPSSWGGWEWKNVHHPAEEAHPGYCVYKGQKRSRYYESLIGDELINELSSSEGRVSRVDAVLYNNHAIMGQIGKCSFNGALVCRDEALIYSGGIYFNWDIRIGSGSLDSKGIDAFCYMPLAPVDPYTSEWKALP